MWGDSRPNTYTLEIVTYTSSGSLRMIGAHKASPLCCEMLWMKMQVLLMAIKLQWVISYTLILGMTNFLMKFNQKPESADECSRRPSGRREEWFSGLSRLLWTLIGKEEPRSACIRPATGPLLSLGFSGFLCETGPSISGFPGLLSVWGSGYTTQIGWESWLLFPPCQREALNPSLWSLSQWLQF